MDPAAAARLAASPSSVSSRSVSSSSPSTRIPPSGSTPFSHSSSGIGGGPVGDEAISSTAVTVEQVLNAHASSSNPARAALESVLHERNNLNAQNSQLWNHLKKQRSSYQTAMSDVKRYRAERDVLRARLAKYEHTEVDRPDERRIRPSLSSRTPASNGQDITKQESPDSLQGDTSALVSTDHRHRKGGRHNSEDVAASRRRSSSQDYSNKLQVSQLQQGQTRSQERGRSNTNPEYSFAPPNGSSNKSSPTSPNDQERPLPISALVIEKHGVRTASPPPIIHPRGESLRSGSPKRASLTSIPQQVIVSLPYKNSEDPPDTARPLANQAIPSISTPDDDVTPTVTIKSEKESDSKLNTSSLSAPSSHISNSLGLPNVRKASRESRISLPDEAKHYYASLADSPMSSPRVNSQEDWNQTQRVLNGDRSLSQVPEETESRGTDSASPRPFLELETTDDSDSERRPNDDNKVREADSEVDSLTADRGYTYKRGDGPTHANPGRLPRLQIGDSVTTADQFPLPPNNFGGPMAGSPSTSSTLQAHSLYSSHSELTASGSTLAVQSGSVTSSTTFVPGASLGTSEKRTKEKVDSFLMPTNSTSSAMFRQMPLLDSDLKTASIEIKGSHIRANDKGKEVLSFVIAINVVGKESWQIEKFYSEVLALDSRLRSRCSRSLVKKLEPLPDSKLFKDHAPAKVDQRKRMLQAYLQSVMHLPVKDKNEIIVFFSSDVVRERSPVTKSGYKEGYLTKRGKNFGGWKTRYFVLQGPVLEYYESRGGTHLGSIQITGAQIGRQQRNGARDSDDENEFRHAFLIIEQKRGPSSQNTRHVLCAESDRERDAWVDVLVRYVTGTYNDDDRGTPVSIVNPAASIFNGPAQPRASTSSLSVNEVNPSPRRTVSKDLIQKSSANPVPIHKLSNEGSNAKFFSGLDPLSPVRSSADKGSISSVPSADSASKKSMEKSSASDDALLSSSLPNSSILADSSSTAASVGQRANSEQGFYPDMFPPNGKLSTEQQRPRERTRASYHPSLGTVLSSPLERPSSPEKASPAAASPLSTRDDATRLGKISAPINGAPIPAGYKFGSKDPPSEHSGNERERKSRSRAFWRWPAGDKNAAVPTFQPRAVFGVPLEESVAVSQIANLPSIVFRCIEYLEKKKADQEEGIYRLSGSSAVIKSMKDRFNTEGDVDLLSSEVHDPHAVAGLLKSFLRELPSSLLTRDLHMHFLAVMDFVDTQERIKELQELISQLPLANYSLLRALTAHLILIVQNSNVNKMTMRNVGIVFSPTLGIPAGVFSLMLGEFNRVFNVNGDGNDSSIEDDEPAAPIPRKPSPSGLSRRNSKRYSDAAADQLLGLAGRTLPATAEDQSDEGDVISEPDDNEESDTEETEGVTVESSVDSVRPHSPPQAPPEPQQQQTDGGLDPAGHKSRASVVAASRGLNISVSSSKADRRRSRLPIGLPVSPRPGHSGGSTPTSTYESSPLQSQI